MNKIVYSISGEDSQGLEQEVFKAGFDAEDQPLVIVGENEVSLDDVMASPRGGTAGQVLTKTATAYDWADNDAVVANPEVGASAPKLETIQIGDEKFKVGGDELPEAVSSAIAHDGIGWFESDDFVTWDGDTTGKTCVIVEDTEEANIKDVLVSTSIPDIHYAASGTKTAFVRQAMEVNLGEEQVQQLTDKLTLAMGDVGYVIVATGPSVYEGFTFPEAGTYFSKWMGYYVSRFTTSNYNIVWDGITTEDMILVSLDGLLMCKISDSIIPSSELTNSTMRIASDGSNLEKLDISGNDNYAKIGSDDEPIVTLVYNNNTTIDGLLYPLAGTYYRQQSEMSILTYWTQMLTLSIEHLIYPGMIYCSSYADQGYVLTVDEDNEPSWQSPAVKDVKLDGVSIVTSHVAQLNSSSLLPAATSDTRGGVRIGSGFTMNGDQINANIPTNYITDVKVDGTSVVTDKVANITGNSLVPAVSSALASKNVIGSWADVTEITPTSHHATGFFKVSDIDPIDLIDYFDGQLFLIRAFGAYALTERSPYKLTYTKDSEDEWTIKVDYYDGDGYLIDTSLNIKLIFNAHGVYTETGLWAEESYYASEDSSNWICYIAFGTPNRISSAFIPSASASATWGSITGTLSNQTDLQNALTSIQTTLNTKQDTLVSGTNIKTINNESLLGASNIDLVTPTQISVLNNATTNNGIGWLEDGQNITWNGSRSSGTTVEANKYTAWTKVSDTYIPSDRLVAAGGKYRLENWGATDYDITASSIIAQTDGNYEVGSNHIRIVKTTYTDTSYQYSPTFTPGIWFWSITGENDGYVPFLQWNALTHKISGNFISVPSFSTTITGNAIDKAFTINHNLNSNCSVTIYDATTKEEVMLTVTHTDSNNIKLEFATAPATTDSYLVYCAV